MLVQVLPTELEPATAASLQKRGLLAPGEVATLFHT